MEDPVPCIQTILGSIRKRYSHISKELCLSEQHPLFFSELETLGNWAKKDHGSFRLTSETDQQKTVLEVKKEDSKTTEVVDFSTGSASEQHLSKKEINTNMGDPQEHIADDKVVDENYIIPEHAPDDKVLVEKEENLAIEHCAESSTLCSETTEDDQNVLNPRKVKQEIRFMKSEEAEDLLENDDHDFEVIVIETPDKLDQDVSDSQDSDFEFIDMETTNKCDQGTLEHANNDSKSPVNEDEYACCIF